MRLVPRSRAWPPLASRASLSLPALGAAGVPRAPSTYDHSTLPLELRHKGIYQADAEATGRAGRRRDPSGPPDFQRMKDEPVRGHHLLVDNDSVYATAPARAPACHPAPLPKSRASLWGSTGEWSLGGDAEAEGSRGQPQGTEYVRRGDRCGDVGWGCYTTNPYETVTNGRKDGHASVTADLLKRNQFMKLSGDPCFDKHAGKYLKHLGNSRRPP